jgi:hypothetical protein
MVDTMDHKEMPQLDDLIRAIESHRTDAEPLDLLADSVIAAGNLQELADELVGHFVDRSRAAGSPWVEIGARLGVTKQAAQKRFAAHRPRRRARRGFFPSRFTDDGRGVVDGAERCARDRRSHHVGTEHLVVGLLEDTDGVAARAIAASGGSVEATREAATAMVERGAGTSGAEHIPFGADAKKALQLALRESLAARDRHIAPEHILLGIVRDKNSPGARLLAESGIDRRQIIDWIERHHSDPST